MDWYTYRAGAEARANTILGRGITAINKLTGKMKIGDGRSALKDLPELPEASGFRVINYDVHAADKVALHAGVVIGQAKQGEWPFNLNVMVETAFDGGALPSIKLGSPGNDAVFSGGLWGVDAVDAAAGGGAAGSGLVVPSVSLFPANQLVVPPGETIDIVLKLVKGDGATQVASNVGLAHVVLTMAAGY